MPPADMNLHETPSETTPLILENRRLPCRPGDVNHKGSNTSSSPATNPAGASATFSNHKPSHDHETSKSISGVNLSLLNIGSVARDHLASERTYLSYVRTSLALASGGIALMQFLRLGESTRPLADILGSLSIIVGILVLLIGTRQFFLVQNSLVNGYFPVSSFEMVSISVVLVALIAATFGIIIEGRNG